MYIDTEVMKECLEEQLFNSICKDKEKIATRFEKISKLVEKCKKFAKEKTIDECYRDFGLERRNFLPCREGWTSGSRGVGILNQAQYFKQQGIQDKGQEDNVIDQDFIIELLSIAGGFDFIENQAIDNQWIAPMRSEFRIISTSENRGLDYKGSESIDGYSKLMSSHFADNTCFIEFMYFLGTEQSEIVMGDWHIAMHYPWKEGDAKGFCSNCDQDDDNYNREEEAQNSQMMKRFPLKFLWMWSQRENVIHPLSLMAFKTFLKSKFMEEIFGLDEIKTILKEQGMGEKISDYPQKITDADINDFIRVWKNISKQIIEKVTPNTGNVSLLISLLTLGETDMANIDELLKTHKQIILYGVPGTGKTHSAKELIRKWSQEEFEDVEKSKRDQDEIDRLQLSKLLLDSENSENKQDGGKKIERDIKIVWEIMQFHPNTTYQDFIGGIVPKINDEGSLSYELRDGKFKEFCEYARVNSDKKFVFIIDEINRANLSEVLGELLYALEYRDEGITIPNFEESFVIPSNVYIIGTMNNVDKSLSTFDLALRRRFGFYEVKPDLESLNKILSFEAKKQDDLASGKTLDEKNGKPLISEMKNYITRCENLNKKIIEKLGDKNAQIGQAYYGKIKHFLNQNEEEQVVTPFHLQKLWDYHLEPLLQEYVGFMDDGEKKVEDLKKVWLGKVEEQ